MRTSKIFFQVISIYQPFISNEKLGKKKDKSAAKGECSTVLDFGNPKLKVLFFVVNRIFYQNENYFGGIQDDQKIRLKTLDLLDARKTRYLQFFQKNFATVLER